MAFSGRKHTLPMANAPNSFSRGAGRHINDVDKFLLQTIQYFEERVAHLKVIMLVRCIDRIVFQLAMYINTVTSALRMLAPLFSWSNSDRKACSKGVT